MNYLSNPIFNVLSKIRWNFHLVFTFPDIYQRNTSLNAIRLRKDTFYNFISRLSGFFKVRSADQIFTFSDEISSSENGHIHALYKLPDKIQRNDQNFIDGAKGIWTAALHQSKAASCHSNPLFISPITEESYKNKLNYVAEIINKSDSVYPTLGESELYVEIDQQSAAFKLVESMQGRDNEWNDSNN